MLDRVGVATFFIKFFVPGDIVIGKIFRKNVLDVVLRTEIYEPNTRADKSRAE